MPCFAGQYASLVLRSSSIILVSTNMSFTVLAQEVARSPREESGMKLSSYFTFAVLVFGLVSRTSAQENSTQVTVSSVVTCVSTGDQRQHCPANTSAGVVILRQSSETNCLLGRNWGYDAQGVWVSEGCGGEFATGSTSRSAAVPGASECVCRARGPEGGDAYRHNRHQSHTALHRHV